MSLLDSAIALVRPKAAPTRSISPLPFNDWAFEAMYYSGLGYPFAPSFTMPGKAQEDPLPGFESYVNMVMKTNGIVAACITARMLLFAEARFQFRRRVDGRPGELFGTAALSTLEHPWTNATTGDLLSRALLHADTAGNAYLNRQSKAIRPLRPDWVSIIIGSNTTAPTTNPNWARDAEVIGYIYWPGGQHAGEPEILMPDEVAHFAPLPDPMFRFRGMSWITPVIREVMGDTAAEVHKQRFWENAATPNLVVSLDKSITPANFEKFVETMDKTHKGIANAYKTLYLAGGATATPVGANMEQADFSKVVGHGETRIAAAARVPAVILQISEGLQGSALNQGNYQQARRQFADLFARPYWRNFAGSIAHLIDVPGGAELWYDDRDIPFLQEDLKEDASIRQTQAQTVRTLIESGYEPDTVIKAVISGRFELLKHTGLYSVQLQTPGSQKLPELPPVIPGEPKPTDMPADMMPPALPAAQASRSDDTELTPREQQVADRLARQMSNKEIAGELGVTEKTVENHVTQVLRKLGVTSRREITEVHIHMPDKLVEVPITVEAARPAPAVATVRELVRDPETKLVTHTIDRPAPEGER